MAQNPSYANFDRYYQEELGNLGFGKDPASLTPNAKLPNGFTFQQQASQLASERILRDSMGSANPQMANPQSATISSSQFVNQPMVPPPQQQNMGGNPFLQAASPVLGRDQIAQQLQMPTLTQQQRDAIRMQVESDFAPQLERIQMGQAARDEQFGIQRAQRSAGTFGLGDREAAGRSNLEDQTRRELTQFERALQAEVQQRIDAAEGRERQNFFDTQGLISQIQGQQLQQLSTLANLYNQDRQFGLQAQQQAAAQAGNTLDFISNLDDTGLQQLINTEGAGILNDLESSLGLPQGYIDQLRATKQRAFQAETQEEIQSAFNEATKTALATPAGTEFTMFIGGEPITFTGQERDVQIVTAGGGIFQVDKNTGSITALRQPTASGGSGSSTSLQGLEGFADFALQQAYNKDTDTFNLVDLQEAINDLPLTQQQRQAVQTMGMQLMQARTTQQNLQNEQQGETQNIQLSPFGEAMQSFGIILGNTENFLTGGQGEYRQIPQSNFAPVNLNQSGGVTTPQFFQPRQ